MIKGGGVPSFFASMIISKEFICILMCPLFRNEFGQDVERALVDADFRTKMKQSGEGTLALTILLDQIPRNIFRGTARPFVEFDPLAREVAKEALALKKCEQLHPVYRHLLYMVRYRCVMWNTMLS